MATSNTTEDENFIRHLVESCLKEAMIVSDEVELMFMKGHKSPEESQQDMEIEQPCPPDCHLKSFLFQHIGQIDQMTYSEDEKIKLYLHTYNHLLQAIEEIDKRLESMI